MEEQRTLTLDFVRSLMEPSYTLVWTDYNDNLDNHLSIIRKCLDRRNRDCLWKKAGEWYGDAGHEAVRRIMEKLKEECFVFNDFNGREVDAFFDEHENIVRDEIYNRNDSDVVKDLIRYTDDIPTRAEILFDYDCINSNWFESQGGRSYEESYFRDTVDSLNLSSAQVKKLLTSHGYEVYEYFPNRKSRNGREQAPYEQFYEELTDSCCGVNLLTYIGKVGLKELCNADFSLKEIITPKGNCYGLSSPAYGGRNLLETELKQDVRLKLEVKDCNDFRFRLDDERPKYNCSIQYVYGVDDSFFNNPANIVS